MDRKKKALAKKAEDKPSSPTTKEEPVRRVPSKEVSILKRKLSGAERRAKKTQEKITSVEKDLNSDGLSSAKREVLRHKKQNLEEKLARAERDQIQFSRQLFDAVKNNRGIDREGWLQSKRARRAVRTIGSLIDHTIELITQLGSGSPEVKQLKHVADAGDRKQFRITADRLIQSRDEKHFIMVTSDPDVHSSVLSHLMAFLKQAGRESIGGNVAVAPVKK